MHVKNVRHRFLVFVQMTFLEFFEALVSCAEVFVTESVLRDPTTPRPSTTTTHAGRTTVSRIGTTSQGSGVSFAPAFGSFERLVRNLNHCSSSQFQHLDACAIFGCMQLVDDEEEETDASPRPGASEPATPAPVASAHTHRAKSSQVTS